MNKLYLLCIACTLCLRLSAQFPQLISFQAQALNSNGGFWVNQNISVRISILEGTMNGTIVYQERHSVTTSQTGNFNLNIGGGNPLIGLFSTVNWATGNKFIKTEIDPINGTNYTLISTTQLLSVPYALYAEKVKKSEYNVEQDSHDRYFYPDGFMNADTFTLTKVATYIVPPGKTLYILNAQYFGEDLDPERHSHLVINEKDSIYSMFPNIPAIIPQNSLVRVYGKGTFKAFLVSSSKNIEPVIVSRWTTYTVPPNKRLYVYRFAGPMREPHYGFDTYSGHMCNVKWNVIPQLNAYYDYIPSGTVIETNCTVVNGYLISY